MKKTSCAVARPRHGIDRSAHPAVRETPRAGAKFPLHVLVVDDEPLIRWSVTESLSQAGLMVEQAGDAASALRKITSRGLPFDVIVLDLRLPDMHDLSLLGTIRQILPTAGVFLMTAFGTPEVTERARELGVRQVMNKPFELDEMKRLVMNFERAA